MNHSKSIQRVFLSTLTLLFLSLAVYLSFPLLSTSNKLADTDQDGIKDVIEDLGKLDKTKDECSFNKKCGQVSINGILGKEHYIMIVDQSGSMQESFQDTTRMEAAKQVVTKYVQTIPNKVNMGLYTYGSEVGCHPMKEIQNPYEKMSKEGVIEQIKEFKPVGDTPIAKSLTQMKEVIGDKKGIFNIILVTDGEDSCQGDPVAAAKDLMTLNTIERAIKLYVVGLGVPQSVAVELEKIAIASDGKYYTINTIDEFNKLLLKPYREILVSLQGMVCLQRVVDELIECENHRLAKVNMGYQRMSSPYFKDITLEEKTQLNKEKPLILEGTKKKVTYYKDIKKAGTSTFKNRINELSKIASAKD